MQNKFSEFIISLFC